MFCSTGELPAGMSLARMMAMSYVNMCFHNGFDLYCVAALNGKIASKFSRII
jgi:hypothetical protein